MLKVIEYGKDEYSFPALLVLGCFDAIHLGHRELIKKAKLQAKINGLDLGVMMFRDGKGGKLVYTFDERLSILETLGVKFVLAIDFNEEFMATAPLEFLATIENYINVKAYMSGKDFRFGAKAKGKASTLKSYAEDDENGVWYMSVKDVLCEGEKVSTTLIKSCLEDGDVSKADRLLGSDFNVTGEVVHGAGRGGEEVGFPTVNIVYPEDKYPVKPGVYKVYSVIDGTKYFGIANYGNCPTFGDDRVALEVYFDGFSGDLYGAVLTIYFVGYIRDIVCFNSVAELSSQLERDIAFIRGEASQAEDKIDAVSPKGGESAAEAFSSDGEKVCDNTEETADKVEGQGACPLGENADEQTAADAVEPVSGEVQPCENQSDSTSEQAEEGAFTESAEGEQID